MTLNFYRKTKIALAILFLFSCNTSTTKLSSSPDSPLSSSGDNRDSSKLPISVLGSVSPNPSPSSSLSKVSHGIVIGSSSPLRQAPSFEKITKYVENKTFNAEKLPNIYFIFIDTLRPDYALQFGKNMNKFHHESFSFEHAYGSGTATWYSLYSLFHALPGFVTYNSVVHSLANTKDYGSYYIKTLHKLGYKINSYGYSWDCVHEKNADWNHWLTSFFGYQSKFLERCNPKPTHEPVYFENRDEKSVAKINEFLSIDVKTPQKNFAMITLSNVHHPYKWGSLSPNEVLPYEATEQGLPVDHDNAVNGYTNAVKAADINFGKILEKINSLPGSEEAIIVLFSDHGEMLSQKGLATHGGPTYWENIRAVLNIKFGKNSPHNHPQSKEAFASIQDIFPTLFEYMRVKPLPLSEFSAGIPLLSRTRKSIIAVTSNWYKPTREMVLENGKYKAWIRVDETDFYNSNSFVLTKFTNIKDEIISENENPCFRKSSAQCKEILFSEFKDALDDMYP